MNHVKPQQARRKKENNAFSFQSVSLLERLKITDTTLFWLKNLLIIGILFGSTAMGLNWLLDPRTFPISSIYIEGNHYTSTAQIEALVAIYAVGGFFHINLPKLREAVEALPWVKYAYIERRWHNGVFLSIMEYQPVAIWQHHVVDNTGQVLKLDTTQLKELPIFDVEFKSIPDVLQLYQTLVIQLVKAKLYLKKIGQYPNGEKYLILRNNIKLILNREHSQLKLARCLKVLPNLLQSHSMSLIQHIDLRYAHGIAIQWQVPHATLQSGFSYVPTSQLRHNGESYGEQ